MEKLKVLTYCTKVGRDGCVNTEGSEHAPMGYVHWCPACRTTHAIAVQKAFENGARWTFDGEMESPTFSPSVKTWWKKDGKDYVCHYFIRAGRIEFCSDSTHELAGKTVGLPGFPEGEW